MAEPRPNTESLFWAALALPSAAERGRFLERACGGDAPLRARVEELLAAYPRAEQFLASPATGAAVTVDEPSSTEGAGTVIGPYRLREQIGEGGMGLVFVAEQTQPVRRKVALKVIKPGMDTRQVIARFEAERQALALMDHPNIAKVLDGGETAGGRPYFVMELVKGVPLTAYCDENRLTPRQRLELFADVCAAVQHAHQKGIIHRDLKPSNVLVCSHDGVPVVKIIDFGVAKAVGQQLTDKTVYTQLSQLVGTPLYMSPEQAGQSSLDIDTRSDIYALGVLLYELLTGTTPFDPERLRQVDYDEVRRIIREEEPPRPSTRIHTLGPAATTASTNRRSEPRQLSRLLRGELDWVVMRCLEKDRNRRYETASALAADVRRYLADEPVQACPPSAAYRLGKLVRRHRGPVLAASLVVLALVAGTIGTGIGLVRAVRAGRGEAVQRRLAEGNATAARQRVADLEAVLDFVENRVFAAARPRDEEGGLGYDVRLRKAVEAALPFVDRSFADQPLIEARLRRTLGLSFRYLGEARIAAEQFDKARALYTRHRGPDDRDTLQCTANLVDSYVALGQDAEALKLAEEALALHKAKLGPEHPDTLESMNHLALSYARLHRHAEALKLWEETLALCKARLGPEDRLTLGCMNNLALSYARLHRYAEALKLNEETLALKKAKLGPDHPDTLGSMNNLANSYDNLGRYAEALKLHEQTLALQKAKLGPDHRDTLKSMHNLAVSYSHFKRHTEALKLFEETLALEKAKFGPDHPRTLKSMHNLAVSYGNLGRHTEALKLAEETLALQKAKLGPDHPDTLESMDRLANSYASRHRHTEAIKLAEEALALEKAKHGPVHPETLRSMERLALCYANLGRCAESLMRREEWVALKKAKLGPDNPDTLWSMNYLAFCYLRCGRPAEALKLSEETLTLCKAKLGPKHPETLSSMQYLAESYRAVGRVPDAVTLGEQTLALKKAELGPRHLATLEEMSNLAASYYRAGRLSDALALQEETVRLMRAHPQPIRGRSFALALGENLAWWLATAPDPKRRDPARAVALATEAVQLRPGMEECWPPLGAAQYRTGKWPEAVAALDKAMHLRQGKLDQYSPGTIYFSAAAADAFFLAMAHWQLGHREEARTWYARAVRWMHQGLPHDDEVRRLRAEADELLGVNTKR
jgi:serine/threonine protein kinase/tetratricopeptide (TPR) repeat protein